MAYYQSFNFSHNELDKYIYNVGLTESFKRSFNTYLEKNNYFISLDKGIEGYFKWVHEIKEILRVNLLNNKTSIITYVNGKSKTIRPKLTDVLKEVNEIWLYNNNITEVTEEMKKGNLYYMYTELIDKYSII